MFVLNCCSLEVYLMMRLMLKSALMMPSLKDGQVGDSTVCTGHQQKVREAIPNTGGVYKLP